MYSGLRRDDGTHAHKVFARRAAAGGQTDGRLRMGAPHFWHASHARAGGRPRPSGLPSGPSPCSRPSLILCRPCRYRSRGLRCRSRELLVVGMGACGTAVERS